MIQSIGCLFDYGIYSLSEKYFILIIRKGPSNYSQGLSKSIEWKIIIEPVPGVN